MPVIQLSRIIAPVSRQIHPRLRKNVSLPGCLSAASSANSPFSRRLITGSAPTHHTPTPIAKRITNIAPTRVAARGMGNREWGVGIAFFAHPLFFFNHTAPTEIYTLSLHDVLP